MNSAMTEAADNTDQTEPKPNRYYQKDRCQEGGPRNGGLFFGSLLVILGALGLLRQNGMLPDLEAWKFWPLIPIWVGLTKLLFRRGSHRWGGIMPLTVGLAFGAHYLGYLPWHWGQIWPALLVLLGVQILLRSLFGRPAWERGRRAHSARAAGRDMFPRKITSQGGPRLVAEILFSGAREQFEGRDFEGGSIRCTCAGYELDLRGARMLGNEAILEIDIQLSGVEMRVPRGWRVEIEVSPVMGAIEDQTTWMDTTEAKRLIVRGRLFMGGVEIKN
jgi:hypothetical protein